MAGKMIIIAVMIYAMVAVGSNMMFGEMIKDAVSTITGG